MYGPQGSESGGAVRALCTFAGLLLLAALIGGLFLGGSELLSPRIRSAEAERIRAEAEALRAETAAKARERALAIQLQQQEAEVELQALRERRARQLEMVEPLAIAGVVTVAGAVFALTAVGCYCLVKRARSAPSLSGADQGTRSSEPHLVAPAVSATRPARQQHPQPGFDLQGVRSDTVSYEGLLAYCDEFLFRPSYARRCFAAGIAPWLDQFYLSVLVAARVVVAREDGTRWILRDRFGGIEDVARQISREAFERFVDAHLPSFIQPSIFGPPGHAYQPASNYSRS